MKVFWFFFSKKNCFLLLKANPMNLLRITGHADIAGATRYTDAALAS